MAGSMFMLGEQKIRPGVYVRTTNYGGIPTVSPSQGIVAVLFRASWGPLGEVKVLEGGPVEVDRIYQKGGTIDAPKEAFRGNAHRVLAYRLGNGGEKASLTLKDGSDTYVLKIEAKYPGEVGNEIKITIRDSLAVPGNREFLVYQGSILREQFSYVPGQNEAQAIVDAVSSSEWITAAKLADGDGTVADVFQQALSGGSDPIVTGNDYSDALTRIEAQDFNVLVTDSEDPVIHAMLQTYVDRVRNEGKRIIGVVGEPTSVELDARLTNSKAFNDPAIVYVANGFKTAFGDVEGYKAAARVAGMIASSEITESLTHAVVTGATDIIGPLTNAEIEKAILSGAIVFTFNPQKQVHIEYGINTLVTPSADQDIGWKKIRRVKTRDFLIDSIAATWDPIVGKINNSPDGRATLMAAAQAIIDRLVAQGALLGGTITEDPTNPPQGDSAWFVVAVDDLDSAEKLYITFGFRFSPNV